MINKSLNGMHVAIVGGGTAGWMAANLLKHHCKDAQITLIESDKLDPIGVGEGSTPYLKQFFQTLGITDADWMPECDATYKAGIRFPGWSTVAGFTSYFHPFYSQLDIPTAERFFTNSKQALSEGANPVHPDDYFVNQPLAAQGLAPISDSLATDVDFGYHFNAAKLGQFLKKHAQKLGVHCIVDHIDSVETCAQDGRVTRLLSEKNGPLNADFFIDCTGFHGLIGRKTFQLPVKSYSDYLFNDRAVTVMTPAQECLRSETTSTALQHGWAWQIPLYTRTGNGYVYSSRHCSPEQAQSELLNHLGVAGQDLPVRHLKMSLGRLDEHWHKNCLSVGLSQGFIEPLEATALMLVQYTVDMFIKHFDANKPVLANNQNLVNKNVNTLTDGVLDYICAHYRMNTRSDTAYWRECREAPMPDNLARLVQAWRSGCGFEQTLHELRGELAYLRPSWYVLFAGMGCFNAANGARQIDRQAAEQCQQTAQQYFGDQRELLTRYAAQSRAGVCN
ncbi:tryptophan halogenase family protein [Gilvimarinus sp. 1_MG-2023]|uniref:tryptophan halogenase family protein n=1 Tax=Gilvimarinus sp. 1_MG-2023 TaxID=3062638 RepID=UPI0026E1811B|nr:tryptophan halogenase family protein [Gilvimarinus sp. 1_MG-2023]MDO6746772.1 tryptophan 7-halogenase [Gilvimarinus sp. 1_MG-2023]